MLENQIPQHPDFARGADVPAKLDLINHDEETFPQPNDPPQGWGLSFFKVLEDSEGVRGRRKGSVFWTGIANLVWWVDFESGVAVMMAGQILPFGGESFHCFGSVCVEAEFLADLCRCGV